MARSPPQVNRARPMTARQQSSHEGLARQGHRGPFMVRYLP